MKNKSLLVLLPALLLQAACSSNPPAPPQTTKTAPAVSKKPVTKKISPAPVAKAKTARSTTPGPATFALESNNNKFNLTPSMPELKAPEGPAPASVVDNVVTEGKNAAQNATATINTAGQAAVNQAAANATASPFVPETVRMPGNTSPAVVALLTEAEKTSKSGDLDNAAGSLERALRIDPRNSALTYKLAALRLKQSKPQLAEELASKAALLAGGDNELKRKSWLLVSEARRLQNNVQGAAQAKAKADSFGQ